MFVFPLSVLLAGIGAALALGVLGLVFLADRRRTRAFETDLDRLHDEIWELREAASGRDRAEAANEAKSRFLASVTHEVRTPLNGILGMAELLSATSLDAEQQTYVAAIRSSGSALASLIDEILDFSKIEAGKVELAEDSFDLVALVEGVAELLAPRAQGKGLEIASTVALDVPRKVVGDPVRLRQILLNLAGNAIKFTETGGVGLRVSLDGGLLRFETVDTGPGVPADRRDAIFEDFEQAEASRLQGGTGLGLAISRRLAERMGGTLTLAPAGDDEGACFTVLLPLPADGVTGAVARIDAARALIVAASPFEAPFLAIRLSDGGVSVTHVETTELALARLEAGPRFDLVFVDCALGEQATDALSAAARQAGVRQTIVLFSPFERRAFGQASLRGFDGWLVKPVRSRSLFALLAPAPGATMPRREAIAPVRPMSTRHVLLAEDNEINALLATRYLQRLGATVTHAPDGLAALALVEAAFDAGTPYAAVVLDIRMPGLDGIELARRIRLGERARDMSPVRLIALSADLVDAERRSATLAGIDECLGKPINFGRLRQALDHDRAMALREECL